MQVIVAGAVQLSATGWGIADLRGYAEGIVSRLVPAETEEAADKEPIWKGGSRMPVPVVKMT